MTRARNRRLRGAAALAFAMALLAGGCGDGPAARPAATSPAPSDSRPAESPTTSTAPTQTPADEVTTGAPAPGSLATPGEESGRLSRRDFPRPVRLGPGWTYAVDAGDVEEGYLGNGTPALARDPRELVRTAVPFGCARRSPMPTPTHALEVDYRASGTPVIAIRSQFADAATARTFFDHRRANLRACVGRGGGAVGPLVTDSTLIDSGVLLNDRTPRSDPWMELAVLDGEAVVLVAAQHRAHEPPLTAGTAPSLARTFRAR